MKSANVGERCSPENEFFLFTFFQKLCSSLKHKIYFENDLSGSQWPPMSFNSQLSSKSHLFCSTKERNSYGFGTIQGCVNDDRIFHFGWIFWGTLNIFWDLSHTKSMGSSVAWFSAFKKKKIVSSKAIRPIIDKVISIHFPALTFANVTLSGMWIVCDSI